MISEHLYFIDIIPIIHHFFGRGGGGECNLQCNMYTSLAIIQLYYFYIKIIYFNRMYILQLYVIYIDSSL